MPGAAREPARDTVRVDASTRFRWGVATATGNRRSHNEDAFVATERLGVVADGMGGHAAGEVAAAIAVDTIAAYLGGHSRPIVDDIHAAIHTANDAIRGRARRDGSAGMGTTLVGAFVVADPATAASSDTSDTSDTSVAVAHVGDSRCYRYRDGVLDLVTADHSLVEQLVRAGRVRPADAAAHPMGNVVTRALGPDPTVDAEVLVIGRYPGRLLLCSDGLSDELSPRTLGRVLAGLVDPQQAADRLVELTLAGPARDNVTALVIDIVRPDVVDTAWPRRSPARSGATALDTPRPLDTPWPLDHDGGAGHADQFPGDTT